MTVLFPFLIFKRRIFSEMEAIFSIFRPIWSIWDSISTPILPFLKKMETKWKWKKVL